MKEKPCRTYWYPLYAYVRRCGHGLEDPQDLTQEFFARLLARNYLSVARKVATPADMAAEPELCA